MKMERPGRSGEGDGSMRFHQRLAIFIGMALAIAGCRSANRGVEQLVKEDRATVYSAFSGAFSEGALGGASQYSNLWHGGMQTFVEKVSDTTLHVITKFDGQTASEVLFTFTPENGGSATLVMAKVKVDQTVMRKAFAGTPKEQLGDIPESVHRAGMRQLMAKYAHRIETAVALNDPSEGWMTSKRDLPPEFYEGMPEEMVAEIRRHDDAERQRATSAPMTDPAEVRRDREAERQRAAAAPMIDPNASAQRVLAARSSSY